MSPDAGCVNAPDLRIDMIPGLPRGGDGRLRGVVLARGDEALVDRVLAMTPAAVDGHAAPVYVLDPAGDLTPRRQWGTRVRVFSGPDAVGDLLAERRKLILLCLPESVATVLDGEPALPPQLHQGLLALAREQESLAIAMRQRLDAIWRSRGMSHWRERFAMLRRVGRGARILVLTSRYSSFVRHAAEDLVDSFQRLGHDALLFMEPHDHETLTVPAYLDAVERHDPDLIVGINFPRWAMGAAIPAGWPHVCWVQDAMQHLFQGNKAAGPLDFVIGHIYHDAMRRAGYAPAQMLDHMVCVSESKFHAGPVRDEQRSRLGCDIAYVSHRSETAAAFAERFFRESGLPTAARSAFVDVCERVDSVIERWPLGSVANELQGAAAAFAAALGRVDDERAAEVLAFRFVRPYAEQRLRHQTLEWAAEIANSHRLMMRIFGKGWETHPTLSAFAAGPLTHGDDLRASYQLAGLHLHVSVEGCGHQRVAECALAGGLPICRRSWTEIYFNNWQASREFVLNPPPPDAFFVEARWPAHVIADHPELMELIRARAYSPPEGFVWDHRTLEGLYAQIERPHTRVFKGPVVPRHARSLAFFGDPIESTFSTPAELEQRVLRAIARGSWRQQMIEGTARRATECVGATRFARRMLDFVADAMASALPMPKAGHPAEAVA